MKVEYELGAPVNMDTHIVSVYVDDGLFLVCFPTQSGFDVSFYLEGKDQPWRLDVGFVNECIEGAIRFFNERIDKDKQMARVESERRLQTDQGE